MCFQNETVLDQSPLSRPNQSNIMKSESEALKSLKSNKDIIIKKADKGSAVVIQNRTDYINGSLKQINDSNFYLEQKEDLTKAHTHKVQSLVQQMVTHKEISQKCADYLLIESPRTANFYLLPKIHKGKLPPPGRPIVSANDCPTEKISQLVDHFIQPLVPKLDSYICDSGHFLWLLDNLELPQNVILCTLDVTSLYTNIPNTEGIETVRKSLSLNRDPYENPSNNFICKLLKLVLTCNNFQFDNKHYLQIGGTGMGTKLRPLVWKRYIDDIFIIWQHGQDELTKFVSHLNAKHKTIKFTEERSTTSINFLDITVNLSKNGKIITSLYCKPTDSHNYLLYLSEHPRHLLRGIPFSLFLRVRRICLNTLDFRQNSLMLATHFIRRGYPHKRVSEALK